MTINSKYRAISLYSGAGGMDYGFEAAGFETAVALEMDHDCCETLRRNRSWAVIEEKVENVNSKEILKAGKLKRGEVSILFGGPPCQPFSKSGFWSLGDTKRLNDPRARTLNEYMRVVEDCLPQVIVLENVAGLSFSGKDEGVLYLLNELSDINKRNKTKYSPHFKILKMVEYGIPQLRERFFMIAHREGLEFEFPYPTHQDPLGKGKVELDGSQESFLAHTTGRSPTNTAWDAIGHLPPPSEKEMETLRVRGSWGDLLPSIPEGENYLWHTDRKGGLPLFGWRTRYWGFLLKLAKCSPSWTIQAQPGSAIGPFHWHNRRLSALEMLKIMTFPEINVFGGRTSFQRQLGNAVPSLMSEIVGREILRQYFGRNNVNKLTLMPERLRLPPPAEEPQAVPPKYKKLMGPHTPHPGTGKGPMAIKRKAMVHAALKRMKNTAM